MKYFTKEHEWVKIDGDKATLGITQYAADELGDITYIELPELGNIKQTEVLTTIESVKAASDIYCAISATITKVNQDLEDSPELINQSAEDKGWICQVDNINQEQLQSLMNEEEYKRFISAN